MDDSGVAGNSGDIPEEVLLVHKHSFTYVWPAPASRAIKDGQFPYMLCGCGLKAEIRSPDKWSVDERGDWKFDPN